MTSSVCDVVEQDLNVKILKTIGTGGEGSICKGTAYETDSGRIFVKECQHPVARLMFTGEFASLTKMLSTGILRMPKPLKIIDCTNDAVLLVLEYIDMKKGVSKFAKQLGEQLARLHLKNAENIERRKKREGNIVKAEDDACVYKFGFDVPTSYGFISHDNAWEDDWVTVIARRVETQIQHLERDYGDRELREMWSGLLPNLPVFFKELDLKPALLHGDLWIGNTMETENEPVVFDPTSLYGHSEYDIAMAMVDRDFPNDFYDTYFSIIPKAPGFDTRSKLYELHYYINHWNHFGTEYKDRTMDAMKFLLNAVPT